MVPYGKSDGEIIVFCDELDFHEFGEKGSFTRKDPPSSSSGGNA